MSKEKTSLDIAKNKLIQNMASVVDDHYGTPQGLDKYFFDAVHQSAILYGLLMNVGNNGSVSRLEKVFVTSLYDSLYKNLFIMFDYESKSKNNLFLITSEEANKILKDKPKQIKTLKKELVRELELQKSDKSSILKEFRNKVFAHNELVLPELSFEQLSDHLYLAAKIWTFLNLICETGTFSPYWDRKSDLLNHNTLLTLKEEPIFWGHYKEYLEDIKSKLKEYSDEFKAAYNT